MIFLELVPRDLPTLCHDAHQYLERFPVLTGINIPDIKRLDIRSTTASQALLEKNIVTIPHIRTQDASIKTHCQTIAALYAQGLRHVLLITGDPIPNKNNQVHQTTPLSLTKQIKKEFPDITIYCGIDPYRQSFDAECEYAEQKLSAGAAGLFSQPFFDPNTLDTFCSRFSQTDLFCGISPVISQRSYDYWATINHVSFPASFRCTLDYNCSLAKDLLARVTEVNQHAYLMPIKVDILDYLSRLFAT